VLLILLIILLVILLVAPSGYNAYGGRSVGAIGYGPFVAALLILVLLVALGVVHL